MFVEKTWRGQRVVGWQAAPPVPPALVLPGERSTPVFALSTDHVPLCLPVDGGLLELAAWRVALLAAPASGVCAVLRSRPDRPVDCTAMDWDQVLVDSIAARQRAMAYESAQQTRDLIDIAATASEVSNDAPEFLGCELGLALGVADSTVSSYVAEAIDLFVRCPATFRALETGAIVPMKASTIRSHTQDLSPETTALVEADVLPEAGQSTMPQLRNTIAKSIIRRDPDGADARHQKPKAVGGSVPAAKKTAWPPSGSTAPHRTWARSPNASMPWRKPRQPTGISGPSGNAASTPWSTCAPTSSRAARSWTGRSPSSSADDRSCWSPSPPPP